MKNKFKKGDKVVFIEYDYFQEPCYICEGEKKVIIKDEEFKCPKCYGKGTILENKKWQINDEFKFSKIEGFDIVNGITYAVFSKVAYTDIIEGTHYTHRYIPINNCFFKEKHAIKACEIKNKKDKYIKELKKEKEYCEGIVGNLTTLGPFERNKLRRLWEIEAELDKLEEEK
jgi:hypothetical protein